MSPESLERVYRLRYECYRRTGAIPASETGLFSDSYDELPNHFSFLLENENEVQATVRISVIRPDLGWTSAPSRTVFGDHPAFPKGSYVEASRLCFAEQTRRGVLFRMLANLTALADHHQVEWLVACPRVEHAHMYKQLFGFRQVAEPRQYFGVNFATESAGHPPRRNPRHRRPLRLHGQRLDRRRRRPDAPLRKIDSRISARSRH